MSVSVGCIISLIGAAIIAYILIPDKVYKLFIDDSEDTSSNIFNLKSGTFLAIFVALFVFIIWINGGFN